MSWGPGGGMCRSRQQNQMEILGSNLISINKLEQNDFGKNVPLTEYSIFVPFQFTLC